MRIVFAGTPDFARTALACLQSAGLEVAMVLTQPDRPAGRGMKLQHSAVKQYALSHGIELIQPRSLRLDGKAQADATLAREALVRAQADAMVVAAYGLILPQWVLDLPRLGCLNIHASLLPRWRGAAPIHRAIEAGDSQTGVTIMQMDAGLDTGPMLMTGRVPIAQTDTTGTLHDKLAALGGRLIVQTLERADRGELDPVAQPDTGVTYANKIDKAEAIVDWAEPAAVIERRFRAFDPFPGATAALGGETLKLWSARVIAPAPAPLAAPGTVLGADAEGITVACGQGNLLLTTLQRPGGKRMPAAQFLHGFGLRPGARFETPSL